MQKKTIKAKTTTGVKNSRKGAIDPAKAGLSPMDRLQASVDAYIEERKRNPPKTDYVKEDGTLLPVHPRLLKSDRAVLNMYEHLHYFCYNPKAPDTGIRHDHAHPIDCIKYMYDYDCISIGELREILQRALQIKLLHERFYRPELVEANPYRRFVVEFVEMLRFMLRLLGYVEIRNQPLRRYCYSWLLLPNTPPDKAFRSDKLALSFENETLSSKAFNEGWVKLCAIVPVKKWMYCKYQDWFLAFNDEGKVDFELTEHVLCGEVSEDKKRDQQVYSTAIGVVPAIRDFCDYWALTHLGTPISEDIEGRDMMIRAERIDVIPKGYIVPPGTGIKLASGFDVYMPKYCRFAAIQRYGNHDFEQLKYALQSGPKHRRHTAGMPLIEMKKLLRNMERVLKQYGASKETIYRILKMLANQHRQAGDPTMHGYGFYPPKELSSQGEIKQMPAHDAYSLAMQYTAESRTAQKTCQEILRRFGFDVDFHRHGMAVNMA